jgi:hypothetical protein
MSAGHGEKGDRLQEQAVAALLTHPSIGAAAESIGVSDKTLRDWLKEPAFKCVYRDARRQVVEGAIARLQQATGKAVETLERNLACGHPGHEIRAGVAILEHAVKGMEFLDLVQRMEQLEQRLTPGTSTP